MNFRIERPTRFVRLVVATRDGLKEFATMLLGFLTAILYQTGARGWELALCVVVLTLVLFGVQAVIDRVASWILWGRDLG